MNTLVLVSFIAGAVHVIAPDHWLPLSLLSWQRRWRQPSLWGAVLLSFGVHTAIGVLIYLAAKPLFLFLGKNYFSAFTFGLLILGTLLRNFTFNSQSDIMSIGTNSKWGLYRVGILLGPAESLLPILVKAELAEKTLAPVIGMYLAGSLIMALIFVNLGRALWERPLWLPRGISMVMDPKTMISVVSVAGGFALALTTFLRFIK
jgi:hypothetical protein